MSIPASLHQHIADLAKHQAVPEKGTLSQTLHADELIKVVLFAFAPNEELSEHTASMPAIIELIAGTARITVGDQTHEARPGTWIYMPPHTRHSIHAHDKVVMLLTLVRAGAVREGG